MARVEIAVALSRIGRPMRLFQFSGEFGLVTVVPSQPAESEDAEVQPTKADDGKLIGFETSRQTAA